MKSFLQYLEETRQIYEYAIKLANIKPTDSLMGKIEKELATYDLASITDAHALPIRKTDPDFPLLNSPEIYRFVVRLNYPASENDIKILLTALGIEEQNLYVGAVGYDPKYFPPDYEKFISGEEKDVYGAKYNKRLIDTTIGATRRAAIPDKFKNSKAVFNTDTEEDQKSPIGSTPVKLPVVKSFAR